MFLAKPVRARAGKMPFKNLRPGQEFVLNFVNRHPAISFKRRASLKSARARPMSAANLAKPFVRLEQVYETFGITSPQQVFNLDESGFSSRTASRARAKAVMESRGHSNSVELKRSSNAEHVTLMPVFSADGSAWTPVAIIHGKLSKWRKLPDGSIERPAHFLSHNSRWGAETPPE